MEPKINEPAKGRVISSGGGFVIACLSGIIGVLAGIALWNAGAHPLLAVLVYLAVPALMILALYVLSSRQTKAEQAKAERAVSENDKIAMKPGHGSGQI